MSEEQFVATVTGQCHRLARTQQFTGQQCRQLRGVGERLAPDLRQPLQQVQALARVHPVQVVLHAQVARHLRSPIALVVARLVEADRPRFDRQGRLRLHHRRHQRGVGAAGQERAAGQWRVHACSDGLLQYRLQLVGGLLQARRRLQGFLQRAVHRIACTPVTRTALRGHAGVPRSMVIHVDAQHRAGHQLVDATVDGVRRRHVVMAQQQAQGILVDAWRETLKGLQRLQFRREQEPALVPAVVQRPLAHRITGQPQRARLAVPHAAPKGALDARQRPLHAPLDDRLQQQARIAAVARQIAQLHLQVGAVVQASVQAQHVAAAVRAQRLQRRIGRCPAMAQRQAGLGIGPIADATPAALLQRAQQRRQLLQQVLVFGGRQPGPDHAAHRAPPQWRRDRHGRQRLGRDMGTARGTEETPCSARARPASVALLSAIVTRRVMKARAPATPAEWRPPPGPGRPDGWDSIAALVPWRYVCVHGGLENAGYRTGRRRCPPGYDGQ
ncbi:hypothetical protein G6F65_014430 [Rhizopus arrhizus]|nr:hypothetical protein G6F65_014430 [Rhizopus arrhizus]